MGCVTNSVTNMIIKANKESDFWSCRSCSGNYEPKICLVSCKQWNNLCILKVIRSSSFKQQWMLILTFRLETLEAGEWWGFFEKVSDFSSCHRRHLRSFTSSSFFLLFGQFCELFFRPVRVNFSIFLWPRESSSEQPLRRWQHPRFYTIFHFFFWFVTLFVSLLCIMERFSSTFSVKMAISDALKFCLRALRETAGEAILQLATCSP